MREMKYSLVFLLIVVVLSCQSKKEEIKVVSENEVHLKKTFPELKKDRYNVAFLIMDGTFNTELTAPYDIFQHTIFRKNIKAMNVFTVANTDKPIVTFEGMRILPDFNYLKDSLPKIDILVVPSAEHHLDTDLKDKSMIDFVKKVDKEVIYVTSHCDGAFVLAKAGLLVSFVNFLVIIALELIIHSKDLFTREFLFMGIVAKRSSNHIVIYYCGVIKERLVEFIVMLAIFHKLD